MADTIAGYDIGAEFASLRSDVTMAVARTVEVNTEGVTIDGERFPHAIVNDITVEQIADDLKVVTLHVYAREVTITAGVDAITNGQTVNLSSRRT